MIQGKRIENNQGLEIVLVSECEKIVLTEVVLIDALVIDFHNQHSAIQLIQSIRASLVEPIYLLPIFLLSIGDEMSSAISGLIDGTMSSVQSETIVPFIQQVKTRRQQLIVGKSVVFSNKILTKALRYLYTHDVELPASIDVSSHLGYDFPLLSSHYSRKEKKEMIRDLNRGVTFDYLHSNFVDTIHTCPNCSSVHLNLREVCPKCSSSNLNSENLIHHFVCANVAPESEFTQSDGLVCPKCNRRLRHIGVDYDKPSYVYNCVACTHQFQQPEMKSLCFNCSSETGVEHLPMQQISNYALTDQGKVIALSGVTTDEIVKEYVPSGFMPFGTFEKIVEYELIRLKASDSETQLACIQLEIPTELKLNPDKAEKIFDDIAEFISNTTTPMDVLCFANNSTYFLMLPGAKSKSSREKLRTLEKSIRRLLEAAFSSELKWDIVLRTEVLSGDTILSTVWSQMQAISGATE